jgi:hypothetical protein
VTTRPAAPAPRWPGARSTRPAAPAPRWPGARSTRPAGGANNTAAEDFTFAAGHNAKANHTGAFVWADSSAFNFTSASAAPFNPAIDADAFHVRATGGARFVSGINATGVPQTGVELDPGGTGWDSISDAAAKANFAAVDGRAVLEALAALPIQSWNLLTQDPAIRHVGPTAQEFHAAFPYGSNERTINSVDADGVAFAAIQALYRVIREQEGEVAAQQTELAAQQARIAELEREVAELQESKAQQQSVEARLAALEAKLAEAAR